MNYISIKLWLTKPLEKTFISIFVRSFRTKTQIEHLLKQSGQRWGAHPRGGGKGTEEWREHQYTLSSLTSSQVFITHFFSYGARVKVQREVLSKESGGGQNGRPPCIPLLNSEGKNLQDRGRGSSWDRKKSTLMWTWARGDTERWALKMHRQGPLNQEPLTHWHKTHWSAKENHRQQSDVRCMLLQKVLTIKKNLGEGVCKKFG